MERRTDKAGPGPDKPRAEVPEPEPRPGEPRADLERTGARDDEPHVEVEPREARQGEPRLMVRRTLLISLTLAVLAMIILWLVFT